MRTITVAAIIALLTMPAYAQTKPSSAHPQQTEQEKAAEKQRLLDEKAYKDSLARIPSSGQKVDPWARVR